VTRRIARTPLVFVLVSAILLLPAVCAAQAREEAETAGEPAAGEAAAGEGDVGAAQEEAGEPPAGEPLLDLDRIAAEAAAVDGGYQLAARPLSGLPAAMAALMLGGESGGQIAAATLAVPLILPTSADAAAHSAVAVVVEIDGPSLLGDDPPERVPVEIYVYALTRDGGVGGFLSQVFELDLGSLGEAVFVGGVKFTGHLELPRGDFVVRVLVHAPAAQRFALRSVEVTVPERSALFTPLVAEAEDAPWLTVREAPHGEMGALELGRALALAELAIPSALPLLRGDEARFDILAWGVSGQAVPETLDVGVRDAEGRTVPGDWRAPVLARQPTGLAGLDRLRVRLPLGELPTGSYFLRFSAPSLGGAEAVTPELPALVVRGASAAELWTDVQRRLAGGEAHASLDLEELGERRRGRQRRVRQAVVAAYRGVLERLAKGDESGAISALMQVENEVLGSGQESPLALLVEAETTVLGGLSRIDPQSLLPVVLLHARAYERYRDELDFGLSTHSRQLAVETAERYARAAGDETARRLASSALSSFGAYLQTVQVRVTGRRLLERAVELDPANRFAMLHLAAGLEKAADYGAASTALLELVAIDPKSPEGRVRLAINLRRLDRTAEAGVLLGRVIDEINPDWVLTLAYQELAAMRLAGGNTEGAVDLLEQAVGRLPTQGGLLLQLAYALDRSGQTTRSHQVLGRLVPVDGSEESASPRHRYNKWPEAGGDTERAAFEEAALVRLPVLAAAVGRLPSAERLDERVQGSSDQDPRNRRGRSGAGEDR